MRFAKSLPHRGAACGLRPRRGARGGKRGTASQQGAFYIGQRRGLNNHFPRCRGGHGGRQVFNSTKPRLGAEFSCRQQHFSRGLFGRLGSAGGAGKQTSFARAGPRAGSTWGAIRKGHGKAGLGAHQMQALAGFSPSGRAIRHHRFIGNGGHGTRGALLLPAFKLRHRRIQRAAGSQGE